MRFSHLRSTIKTNFMYVQAPHNPNGPIIAGWCACGSENIVKKSFSFLHDGDEDDDDDDDDVSMGEKESTPRGRMKRKNDLKIKILALTDRFSWENYLTHFFFFTLIFAKNIFWFCLLSFRFEPGQNEYLFSSTRVNFLSFFAKKNFPSVCEEKSSIFPFHRRIFCEKWKSRFFI